MIVLGLWGILRGENQWGSFKGMNSFEMEKKSPEKGWATHDSIFTSAYATYVMRCKCTYQRCSIKTTPVSSWIPPMSLSWWHHIISFGNNKRIKQGQLHYFLLCRQEKKQPRPDNSVLVYGQNRVERKWNSMVHAKKRVEMYWLLEILSFLREKEIRKGIRVCTSRQQAFNSWLVIDNFEIYCSKVGTWCIIQIWKYYINSFLLDENTSHDNPFCKPFWLAFLP